MWEHTGETCLEPRANVRIQQTQIFKIIDQIKYYFNTCWELVNMLSSVPCKHTHDPLGIKRNSRKFHVIKWQRTCRGESQCYSVSWWSNTYVMKNSAPLRIRSWWSSTCICPKVPICTRVPGIAPKLSPVLGTFRIPVSVTVCVLSGPICGVFFFIVGFSGGGLEFFPLPSCLYTNTWKMVSDHLHKQYWVHAIWQVSIARRPNLFIYFSQLRSSC